MQISSHVIDIILKFPSNVFRIDAILGCYVYCIKNVKNYDLAVLWGLKFIAANWYDAMTQIKQKRGTCIDQADGGSKIFGPGRS